MCTMGISPNPKYALTAEKYAAMVRAYKELLPKPTQIGIMEKANVGRPMSIRALTDGWPELNLPALGFATDNLADPDEVRKLMETTPTTSEPPQPKETDEEDNLPNVEAANLARSVAVKTGKAIEKLAEHYLDLINQGAVALPDELRPEHLLSLAKMADVATGAISKALAAERAVSKNPEEQAGSQLTALLVGATADELRQVVLTGLIPSRLIGIQDKPKAIDVEVVEPVVAEPGQKKENGS